MIKQDQGVRICISKMFAASHCLCKRLWQQMVIVDIKPQLLGEDGWPQVREDMFWELSTYHVEQMTYFGITCELMNSFIP